MPLSKLKNKELLLASASPRRKELLENAGFKFKVISGKEIDETIPEGLSSKKAAIYLSEIKSYAYLSYIKKNTILITADTVVCIGNDILGKPENYSDAFKMLRTLSGKKHKVITGVTIRSADKKKSFAAKTFVKFKTLTDKEIEYYIKNYKPYDKAGAYGIQEWIGHIGICKIKGSYFNVMGLPVQKVYEVLRNF